MAFVTNFQQRWGNQCIHVASTSSVVIVIASILALSSIQEVMARSMLDLSEHSLLSNAVTMAQKYDGVGTSEGEPGLPPLEKEVQKGMNIGGISDGKDLTHGIDTENITPKGLSNTEIDVKQEEEQGVKGVQGEPGEESTGKSVTHVKENEPKVIEKVRLKQPLPGVSVDGKNAFDELAGSDGQNGMHHGALVDPPAMTQERQENIGPAEGARAVAADLSLDANCSSISDAQRCVALIRKKKPCIHKKSPMCM